MANRVGRLFGVDVYERSYVADDEIVFCHTGMPAFRRSIRNPSQDDILDVHRDIALKRWGGQLFMLIAPATEYDDRFEVVNVITKILHPHARRYFRQSAGEDV